MDPVTSTAIATAAVGFLAPYLAKAGEAAAKKIGEDIYQAIKAQFAQKPSAQEALADLEKNPTDADLQAALRVQLKKLLSEDESFVTELQKLLQKAGKTEAGKNIIQQIAGDNAMQFGQVFGDITFGKD